MAAPYSGLRRIMSGARSAQSFVRGGGDDVRVRHRRRMHASGDQSGEVRHVHQVDGSDLVGDLPHAGEVDDARIGRAAADDELGLLAHGDGLHLVIVEGLGLAGDAVADDAVGLAAEAELVAVGEVAAVGEVESHDGVARLDDRGIGSHVGRRTGVRLHVDVLGSEELLGALAG